jgi:hypothetical protein
MFGGIGMSVILGHSDVAVIEGEGMGYDRKNVTWTRYAS